MSSTAARTRTPRPVTPLGILAERLARLAERDDLPVGVGAEVAVLARLAGGFDPYLEQASTPESPALRALAERTRAQDWSGSGLEQEMLSGHVEGQVLKTLVAATRARRVLEIGMFTGYSALAMAEALPDDGVLVACELDPAVAERAKEAFAGSEAGRRITVEVGPAADTLRALDADGEVFDLVFVDADKAGYADYLAALLDSGLLAAHGLICVDNTLMQGEPWVGASTANGAAIVAFNDAVAADDRVEQVLLPLRDGLTLIRRA